MVDYRSISDYNYSEVADYIKNAVEVKNLDSLKKALKDDLINQYTEKMKEEQQIIMRVKYNA